MGWNISTQGGGTLRLDAKTPAVQQVFDDQRALKREGEVETRPGRIIGWANAEGEADCAVAVRDFWQNYPKGYSLSPEGLEIGLCPDFAAGRYDTFPFEKEGHHLYYYLLQGRYRLKRGISKTHEIFLCFEDETNRAELCLVFQCPLLATAPPARYCDSKVFYDVAPRDLDWLPLYEQAVDRNVAGYAVRQKTQRDFGKLNYGD